MPLASYIWSLSCSASGWRVNGFCSWATPCSLSPPLLSPFSCDVGSKEPTCMIFPSECTIPFALLCFLKIGHWQQHIAEGMSHASRRPSRTRVCISCHVPHPDIGIVSLAGDMYKSTLSLYGHVLECTQKQMCNGSRRAFSATRAD